ncbi:MAG: MFS transporter [Gammaproteobacteria bacterium]|nr:MFS transporter [Gammaproteobacteria bacterium]MBT8110516.1 MFS transporter [Gammaproteobacteria bacterium]NND46388.1 MFS transporter [Woeseiaceae bacterium]NNL45216.1 MFS transporter [Woeseiaceae bacterium]
MNEDKGRGLGARFAKTLSGIEANELKATMVATLFIFILMASYYILRPVRDAMASDWTDTEVSFLWNINFIVSAGIVALYGFAVSRIRLRRIVPAMYGFFAVTFVGFYLGVATISDRVLVDKAFYLWVSVFALFHVSVFWTFMADTFNKGQARRLFGIIGAGASAGALIGPAIPTLFAATLGTNNLMLIASAGLLLVIPLVFYLYSLKSTELGNEDLAADTSRAVMGGNWWHGFKAFVANPYLLGIGAFILLYVFIGSFVYFEQKNLLADFTRAERTQILGGIDWIVNLLTFGLAFFVTGRIVDKLGMPVGLALMPVLVCIGMLILAFAPVLTVLLALQVIRRGGNYGLTRPAREMLYTHVSKEDRFKTKPVIDIVVYRGGDAMSGSLFAILTDKIGLGLAAVALVGSAIAASWAWVGTRLGRAFDARKSDTDAENTSR